MKALLLPVCLLCFALPAIAQSSDAMKYVDRPIALLSNDASEGVMPMAFTENGQKHLEFVPASKIKESIEKGGQSIRLGDVLSALSEATQTIAKLQAENATLHEENEKLWKVAMKGNPQIAPPTVIVQQPAPQGPSRVERYMMLRSLLPAQNQNLSVTVSNCTRFPALCAGR